MFKRIINCVFILFFIYQANALAKDINDNNLKLSLKTALETALKNNKEVKEAISTLPISQANLIIAKYFPNPVLASNAEVVNGGSLHPVQLGQTIELGRKRHYRVEIAKEQISKTELQIAKVLWEIHSKVHIGYAELAIENELFDLAKKRVLFYKSLLDIAQKRFSAGDISGLELNRASMELLSAENDIDNFEERLNRAMIEFNKLLGNDSMQMLTLNNTKNLSPSKTTVEYKELDGLIEKALTKRLEIAILERDFGITRAELKKAKWERLPNLYFEGGAVRPSQGKNNWGPYFGGTLELPVFNRKQGEIKQLKAKIDYFEKNKEKTEIDIKTQVANAKQDLQIRERQVLRFQKNLLSQSEDILEKIKEGYKKGKIPLTDVLNAEQKNRDLRQQFLNSLFEYQFALANLEYSVGTPLYELTEKL